MEKITSLLSDLGFQLADLNTPDNWIQIGIIAAAMILSFFISRFLIHYLAARTGEKELTSLRKFALRSIERLLLPVTALLLVLLGEAILLNLQKPAQILQLAATLFMALAGVRFTIYILRKGFAPSPLLKAWEHIISSTLWIIVALYLLDWLPAVTETLDSVGFKFGNNQVTALSIINFVLLTALFFTLALWISNHIAQRMQRSTTLNPSLKVAFAKLVKVAFIAIAFLVALDAAGIDLTALTVFGGALGVGLGFGLQRIASNFISGFLLLFDKSIKPGDVISIGNKFGWVEQLHARYIVVRDRDGVDTLIPNENLVTTDVINWSYKDKNVRLKIPVSISYHDDPEKAMALMIEAANETARVLTEPAAVVRLLEFGDNGILLELRVWINDPEQGLNNVRSEEAGITIPFPQRDLYIKQMPQQ
jgi:small-conductance mechanosensitive channel